MLNAAANSFILGLIMPGNLTADSYFEEAAQNLMENGFDFSQLIPDLALQKRWDIIEVIVNSIDYWTCQFEDNGRTERYWAEIKETLHLIQSKQSPDTVDGKGKTKLFAALEDYHSDVAFMLMGAGADLSIQDKDGKTPLLWCMEKLKQAPRFGNQEIKKAFKAKRKRLVMELIKTRVALDVGDDSGSTPLTVAIDQEFTDIALALIDAGADVNKRGRHKTPLILAIFRLNKRPFDKLIAQPSIDIDGRDSEEKTALIWACMKRQDEMIKKLVQEGADVDAKDKHNMRVMMFIEDGKQHLLRSAGAKSI